MPRPDAVTIAIFLDDVHNDNGPLRVLPGTHRLGLLDQSATSRAPVLDDWRRDVSADLKYQITPRLASELAMSHSERVLIGPAGTVCAFHPSIVHASSDNKSKDRRCVLLITYNSINNVPTRLTRPEFLVDRDTVALPTTGSDDLVDDSADAP
jgi:ectoine hydroxylase